MNSENHQAQTFVVHYQNPTNSIEVASVFICLVSFPFLFPFPEGYNFLWKLDMPRSESEHRILTKRCSDSDLSISNYAVISVFDCNLQSVKSKLVLVVKNAVYSYWNIVY